ncbi:lipoprotein [Streptomyces spiroverticillatus]|uniref:Lipoprotein n=1 Tax=Streptomyces finlayi TaxID=67296 RepID=A0A919CD04_9ACTN|nr:CapA family protein [Streptomyces finlayi]GHA26371.1 lipoprotein [Streptomyces spiroverticillatus]GHD07897.1 lipoprotein [Streptomyces finlayi]
MKQRTVLTPPKTSARRATRQRYATAAVAALLLGATACTASPASAPAPTTPKQAAPKQASPKPGAPAAPQRGFTLVASGDVLPHDSIIRQARTDAGGDGYDFAPMLAGVKSVVSRADLAICHMETVYGGPGGPYSGYPAFVSPPQVAAGLRATGYDSCSTASNHTLDDGRAGIRRTLGALDKAGIAHAGSARTAAEAARPALLKAGTAKVAQLAYSYGTNGYPLPDGQPWAVNLIDRGKIVADARAARKAGADVVVVSLHWGTEWQDEPDEKQLSLGRALTASTTAGRPDIDLILGTHAHVPQAYEKVNGTYIIYGMGDQIAGTMFNHSGAQDDRGNMSSIGRFTFAPPAAPGKRWEVKKAEFIPQFFDLNSNRVLNLGSPDAGYPQTREHIRRVVLSRGAAKYGLTMGR